MARHSRAGFSLLELSIVLAIISVIVSYGITIGSSAIKGSERMTTRERQLTIQKAIDNYARINGYLPCPANRAQLPGTAGYGVESRNTTTFTSCDTSGTGIVRAPASGTPFIYIGAVPVRNLGLPDLYMGDAWNDKFLYAVDADHVGNISSYATNDARITILTGDRTGTNYKVTDTRNAIDLPLPTTAVFNAVGAGATYVVVSHGPDGKGAYPVNGTSVAIACGTSNNNDVENCDDANMDFYESAYNEGNQPSTFFDDYVVWGGNALSRIPKKEALPTGCGTSVCESWCVACANAPTNSTYQVCSRVITSSQPNCQAFCTYAYPTLNVVCP